MQTQGNVGSGQQKSSVISEWNLDDVKLFMVQRGMATKEEVDLTEVEYRRYLQLNVMYPDLVFPMSVTVDPMWHAHLLFTVDYKNLERSVGMEINHKPSMSDAEIQNLSGAYHHNLLPLYERHFGKPNERFWPKNGMVCKCCGNSR